MKTTRSERELARLRAKHGRDRTLVRSFPDLRVTPAAPSLSNGFSPIVWHPPRTHACNLFVDHIHKSGLQVLSRSELPYAGGRKV